MNRTVWLLVVSVAICLGIALYVLDRPPEEAVPAQAVAEAGVSQEASAGLAAEVVAVKNRPIQVLTAGYASADSCLRCHQ